MAHTDRAMMIRDITELREEIADLRGDVKGLIAAWQSANTIVAVMKWASTAIIAVSALWFTVIHFGERPN